MSRSTRKTPIESSIGRRCKRFVKTAETGAIRTHVRTSLTALAELDTYLEPRRIAFGYECRTRELGKYWLDGAEAAKVLRSK